MKKILTLIFGNLVVLSCLIVLANFSAITVTKFHDAIKTKPFSEAHLLPNYHKAPWAKIHFDEYYDLRFEYEAFYGWRRQPFQGQTINIDGQGLRHTLRAEDTRPSQTIAFFGGSTMWGAGVDDNNTIPSVFARLYPDYVADNFGETSYVAHQSLNLFMKMYLEGYRPDVVVFYDGINEVFVKCRSELDFFSDLRESKMRNRGMPDDSYSMIIQPVRRLIGKIKRYGASSEADFYDCDNEQTKAKQVARALLLDWMIAKHLIEAYGGRFVGALQPVIYFSDTRKDHLDTNDTLKMQYESVYPLIVDVMNQEFSGLRDNFLDLRDVLDLDEYFYIDWCHLSPNGNQRVAARIGQRVATETSNAGPPSS